MISFESKISTNHLIYKISGNVFDIYVEIENVIRPNVIEDICTKIRT